MSLTSSLLSRVLQGGSCTREELIALSREPLEELCQAANAIREHFCGNVFDLCTIINGRSGKCSENCKGLCSGCGVNLNTEKCRCSAKKKKQKQPLPNDTWSALDDLKL